MWTWGFCWEHGGLLQGGWGVPIIFVGRGPDLGRLKKAVKEVADRAPPAWATQRNDSSHCEVLPLGRAPGDTCNIERGDSHLL